MTCGKKSMNRPTEDFILASPAPVDVAAKISAIYKDLSVREKERARDLTEVKPRFYLNGICGNSGFFLAF